MSKRKLNSFSVSEKVKIIKAFQSGKSRNEIVEEFKVPKSTLCRIIKNSEKLEKETYEGHGKSKRFRPPEHPNLEGCLVKWLKECRNKDVPISGQLLKEKAKSFAEKLGIIGFTASNGWLEGFKKRNDIVFRKMCGESNAVDTVLCNQWIEDLPHLLEDYSDDDIFNADETGVFFKCLPEKTFTFKNSQCHGGKQSKERVTVLLCANMSGTEKLPPLVIGKPARPRCFKNVKSFPVEYKNNKKAWMTTDIFKDWLKKIDRRMKLEKRKILLFIDNCTAHTDLPKLEFVKVKFLPANTTSKLQPLDQGVIQNFKIFYRKQVVKHVLNSIDEGTDYEINLLHAMRFTRKAWHNVTKSTIANCFKKSGFKRSSNENDLLQYEEFEEQTIEIDSEDWDKVTGNQNEGSPTFEDYVQVDENVSVCGELTEEDILETFSEKSDEENEEIGVETGEKPIVTKKEAMKALSILEDYFEMKYETEDKIFDQLNDLEKSVNKCDKKRQTKLTDFF